MRLQRPPVPPAHLPLQQQEGETEAGKGSGQVPALSPGVLWEAHERIIALIPQPGGSPGVGASPPHSLSSPCSMAPSTATMAPTPCGSGHGSCPRASSSSGKFWGAQHPPLLLEVGVGQRVPENPGFIPGGSVSP